MSRIVFWYVLVMIFWDFGADICRIGGEHDGWREHGCVEYRLEAGGCNCCLYVMNRAVMTALIGLCVQIAQLMGP